ncbi:MAG: ABC transporter permease subunit [Acidimicrobiia bacterium]|nr:ABC transporter permease [Acidimicrobiia bacterium]NNF10748.1 ABC transporter permease subunit [Acidimicrobiia bacterium]
MLASVLTKTIRDRWLGYVIGGGTLALLLLMGMAVYQDIDISFYNELPDAYRSLVGIPENADIGGLAYGAIYASYGALTLAGLGISAGSAAVAREERFGTLGILLGNPRSRTHIVASKAASMVLLTTLGAGILWGGGLLAPMVLGVDVGGVDVGALVIHMFFNTLFYGFLAMAIGAWTGKTVLASGATVAVMVVSFIAAGLLPLVSGYEDVARAFPWYYFQSGEPIINGVSWADMVVLGAGIAVFAGVALVGVNRRDLRNQAVGVTLIDRLRANPMTRNVFDRLAGSTRVSRVWVKTASEQQGLLVVTAGVMLSMGLLIGPMYSLLDEPLIDLADQFPETMLALFGGGDMSTPEGFYQVETYGLMAPIAVMVATIAIGARALAGEEAAHTMDLLLTNPIRRSVVVLEKAAALVLHGAAVGVGIFIGVALGATLGGLDMSVSNIAATSTLAPLIGILFGALALAVSAATGRIKAAVWIPAGLALVFHVMNALLSINAGIAGWAKLSPFYYYLGSDPLLNGMPWGHAALLVALSAGLIAGSVVLFERRDVRQTG